MKKVSKAILIGLGAVLLGLGALVVGLNLYIQSPGAQTRIQEELSKALRLPLKITNTSVTPWSDLRISGISIPHGDANFLEATSFTASYRLLPLLGGKLIIDDVRVERPKVLWRQDASGKWKLPEPAEAAAVAREETPAAPPALGKEASPGAKKDVAVIIHRLEIKDGAFEMLDKDGRSVAVLSGVNMVYTKLTAEHVEGIATIGKAAWTGGVTLENLHSPFSYIPEHHEFRAPELAAALGGGTVRGSYHSRAEGGHVPFKASLAFETVNLDRLVTQSGGEAGQATGELRGTVELYGDTDRPEKMEGRGALELHNGQFRQLELFQNIGQVLGLRELSNLRLEQSQADLRLSGDKVYVERLLLTTSDLQLSSKGLVQLNKKVALEAQLSVDEKLVKQLPDMVRDSFAKSENARRTIDFNITGTTEKLKTNLLDKLVGQKINAQFGDLLGSLFGGDRKAEEDKKKKQEEERKKAEKKEKKKKEQNKDREKDAAAPETVPPPVEATQPPAPAPNP